MYLHIVVGRKEVELVPGARTRHVDKTLERYNDRIPPL